MACRLSLIFSLFYLITSIGWTCRNNKNSQAKEISTSSSPELIDSHPRVEIVDVLIGGSGSYFKGKKPSGEVKLKHDQTEHLGILFQPKGFAQSDSIELSWKLHGFNDWSNKMTFENEGTVHGEFFDYLKPGKYTFMVKTRKLHSTWETPIAHMTVNIAKPVWQSWWLWSILIFGTFFIFYVILKLKIKSVKLNETRKAEHEKHLLELEAKALRAQMNPHFIFNCLNSIKYLIQEQENEKSVVYLTTFSKLIRTLFDNADKKEILLYDEIETCKLYLQLEAMRFDAKFSYSVNVDKNIDLKSIHVPALIIQPFIENAIWHGIVPAESVGHISIDIIRQNGKIKIIVEDNGIGRESSHQNKPASMMTHHSKGVSLTQSRLQLDSLLQKRQAHLEIIDLKDEAGIAKGTKVIISINEESVC